MVRLRAGAGVRSRAKYNKNAELFRYLEKIVTAQHVENMEKEKSFAEKMRKDKANSNAPTFDPESWEEFKQMLPQELKQTLAGQEFCCFVCDIAETEDAVKEGMIVFASDNSKERMLKSPHWLLEGKWMENGLFKQVTTF